MVSACTIQLRVKIDIAEDGSGQITAGIGLDEEARNQPALQNIEEAKSVAFVNTALEDLNLLKNRDYRFGMGIDAERFMLKFLYILDTTTKIKSIILKFYLTN